MIPRPLAFVSVAFLALTGHVPAAFSQTVTPADLQKDAATAAPAVASLYRFLAAPADKLALTDGGTLWVMPLPQFLGSRPAFAGTLDVTVVSAAEAGKKKPVSAGDLAAVTPFEEPALDKLAEFLDKDAKDLIPSVKLEAAEKGLQALAWFHDGTRTYPPAGVSPWHELRERIHRQLKKVRGERLGVLVAAAKQDNVWSTALSYADRLSSQYADDSAVGHDLRQVWTEYGLLKISRNDYAVARKLLTRMQTRYLRSPEAKPLREKLQGRARELFESAQKLSGREAEEKLAEALTLWPRLPQAAKTLRSLRGQDSVLYVGVRRLPEFLSPATAWTDGEKQALDLLFEALVQPDYRPALGQRYQAILAARLPGPQPLLRHIDLRQDAYWSDGARITSADVRHTIQLLLETKPAWRDLLQVPRLEQESFAVDIGLSQGYIDPLGLISFKVLPQRFRGKPLLHADDVDFARAPVGSGAFRFSGIVDENGRKMAVFSANPNYTRKPQPVVGEIRIFAWAEREAPWKETAELTRRALLLDVPTEDLDTVKVRGTVRTLLERRVYFLALNHRVPALADADLRRALGHALDRDKILNDCFRGGVPELPVLDALAPALALPLQKRDKKHPELHHALNGLYPADSWAFCPPPRVPASLHDAGRAKALFRAVKAAPLKFTLKYPDDDPHVAAACFGIAHQVERRAGEAGLKIQVRPVGLSPHGLRQALAKHDYELAYCHLDFDGEDYCLLPLFDPHPDALRPGASNFLGYENDAKLQSLFRAALAQRLFPAVRDITHAIHAHLVLHMPVIPLWQLHRHVLVPTNLDPGEFEPLHVFRRVAQWKVNKS